MFGYYLDLALHSLKRNKVLTALMVLAIALGIGASMTTLTVLHVLSGDPLPGKSQTLFVPQLDPEDMDGYQPSDEPPDQMTWIDGMNLLRAGRADHQALMVGGSVPVEPANANVDPFYADARYTTADFFTMFNVPMLYGHAWTTSDDNSKARVAIITSTLNNKLFDGKDSTGQTLQLGDDSLRIIGVLNNWRPSPHYYDLRMGGSFALAEDVYVPLSTSRDLGLTINGSINCWGGHRSDQMATAPCTWLQFWVELDSPAKVVAYKEYLTHYSQDQKSLGRFQRPVNVRLRDLMGWLDYQRVVPSDVQLQTWLAFGFLLVCLVNTVGLMLAKFMRRASELGVRRALGASKRALFMQLLVESGVIGLSGGIGGLLLAALGLWLVRQRASDYATLAHLDMSMLLATFLLAVSASLVAGLLPAWRACQVTPGLQLKSN
ncbi:MAG: ABC transporter permease [Rhodanobacter sp.]